VFIRDKHLVLFPAGPCGNPLQSAHFPLRFSSPFALISCRFFSQSVSSLQISGVVLPSVFNYQLFGNFGDSGNAHPTPTPVFVPYRPKVSRGVPWLRESAEGRNSCAPSPSYTIPSWRRFERVHPKSSQVGVELMKLVASTNWFCAKGQRLRANG